MELLGCCADSSVRGVSEGRVLIVGSGLCDGGCKGCESGKEV